MCKISVVTVNYNNSKGLIKTILSVIEQDYDDVEFIIVDGGSTDGFVDVVEKYKESINVLISEKDSGIYDAMNKGINNAKGEWISFMNSGDTFYSSKAISNVFKKKVPENINLIYGAQFKLKEIIPPLPAHFLMLGIIHACHQAMFFRNGIHYDLRYKIYGDYDLVARLYKQDRKSLLYSNEIVCEFEGGGVSSSVSKEKRIDKYRAVYNIFGLKSVFASFLYMIALKVGLK
ncbi:MULTISPECIES: glycosyltransferase family 2 protein [unclassified Pseudoalteromonas]|uniref:glycosyltransferase family 2 protein n=1 Tax=unclassified Pseudoalteromonas TaxID=194690 RepID=UPI0030144E99